MNALVERLDRRYQSLSETKMNRLSKWQEVSEYFQPERAIFFGGDHNDAEDRIKIYDSTPEDAAEQLAAALHAYVTSWVHAWFGLDIVGEDEADSEDVKDFIDAAAKAMLNKINSEETGFHTAIHEFWLELPVIGISGFFVENPEKGKIRFYCEPVASFRVAENAEGKIDTIFREFSWTARKIFETWPKTSPACVKEAYEKNPDQKFQVVHAIEPRTKFKDNAKRGKDMAIGSYYYEVSSKELLEESGHQEQTFFAPRWAKHAKDPWGRGLGQKALPDVRVLNQIEQDKLIAANRQAQPDTLLPHDGFLGNWDSGDGALNFHRFTGDIREKVMTIGSDADLNAFQMIADQKRDAIRRMFLNDKILPPEKQMTATEYVGTSDANMRVLGPIFGRLQSEFLGPMLNRVFNIMMRDGELPDVPKELAGKALKVTYISPITRQQKQIDAQNFSQAINHLAPLAQVMPQVQEAMIRHFDIDHIVRDTQERFGYPAKNLKSLEVIEKEDQARAKAQQEQQDKMKMAQDLELAGKAKEIQNSGKANNQQ